jgi:hypothetical protein
MDYFSAVQEGRRRVNRAMAVLQDVAGPCYPMLFLKMGVTEWTPVGDESMHKVIPGKAGTAALVLCDSDGNSKAMSAWFPEAKARGIAKEIERKGFPEFPDEVKLPI